MSSDMATSGLLYVGFFIIVHVVAAEENVIDRNELPIQKKRGECVTFTAKHYYPLLKGNLSRGIKWFKYSTEVANETGQYLTIKKLTPSDSALYYSEMHSEGGREVTRYWLTVQDCDINEKKMLLSSDCDEKNSKTSIACEAVCDVGWHYFSNSGNEKCFKYYSEPKAWEDAHTSCQSTAAQLATIDSDDENTFVGSLLQSGDGGWIGLNDKSQESIYIWNYQDQPTPKFFAWDKSSSVDEEPNNNNDGCNIENCVELKYSTKKWNDAVCNSQFGYICQVYADDDIPGWKCKSGKCYKYDKYRLTWKKARAACMAMNGTLVTISSRAENDYVSSMINESAWIGLNDIAEAGIYVWNDIGKDEFQNRATYFYWDSTEPNDKQYNKLLPRCTGEDCVQIKKWNGSVTWSDLGCATTLPFVCEKRKDMYISFAAWIAISMGAGLVISIVAARGYMEYKSKRGKKDIKAALIAEHSNVKT